MPNRLCLSCAVLMLAVLAGCRGEPTADRDPVQENSAIGPGVPLQLAEARASTYSNLRYELWMAVPAVRTDPIHGRVTVRFVTSESGVVVFDFAQPREHVRAVLVDGAPVSFRVEDEHIVLTDGVNVGDVSVEIEFVAGDGSLNRQDDFIYSLFVPDRARVAFPLFDQPDLKARFRLSLEIPIEWRAVANGAVASRVVRNDRTIYAFAETEPISSYLFAFAAGKFEVEEAERSGRRMVMYHRETDRARVDRNREALFDLHAAALSWLEEYTGIPYPFQKFDFILIPSFQYGGMEHPGAVLYRAESLLLDETATQRELMGRASVISHETAHMWFGDFVTMEWFNDVWMKEVFANFMAAKIVNPSFPEVDHDLRFLLAHYPAAYDVDRTPGTHPIRQDLDNLNEAGTLYGPIIYQKAPVVMRHLELLMGETDFRDGLREYLRAHRFGNATWTDLVDQLDRRSEEDLRAWSQVWVEESGRPTVELLVETVGRAIDSLSVRQADPAERGRLWNQRLDVVLGYRDQPFHVIPTHLREASIRIPEAAGRPVPDFVVANGTGMGYGFMVLDERSLDFLLEDLPTIENATLRAVAWVSLWDAFLDGRVAPDALIALAVRALPDELEELNVQLILDYLTATYWRYLVPERRLLVAEPVEDVLWRQATSADRLTLAAAFFDAYRRIALTADAVAHLERIWRGDETVPGLPLAERDFMAIAQILAVRNVAGNDTILARQLDRIENPDRRNAFEFVIPALSNDPKKRDAFLDSLGDLRNRAREPWVLTGVGFLHHPLRARESEQYIRPSLDLLEEIHRTGDIFFPERWLGATLGGHQTAGAAEIVRDYLGDRDDLAPRLRAKVLQASDGLFRAARIVGARAGD